MPELNYDSVVAVVALLTGHRGFETRLNIDVLFLSRLFVCPVSQDSAGRSTVREQHFTLEDDLTPSFGFVQSFILLTDHYILGRVAFIFMMLLNVGVLLAFRFLRVPSGRGELSQNTLQINTSS